MNLLDKMLKTPASSPDINSFENVWSAMKGFLSRTVKPRKRDELVDGKVASGTLTTFPSLS